MELTIQERINFLQRYIIVHSYIYYELNENIISDMEYDKKARELANYQKTYPDLWEKSEYYKQFGDDYTGETGFTLYHDLDEKQKEIVRSIVHYIFKSKRRK